MQLQKFELIFRITELEPQNHRWTDRDNGWNSNLDSSIIIWIRSYEKYLVSKAYLTFFGRITAINEGMNEVNVFGSQIRVIQGVLTLIEHIIISGWKANINSLLSGW